MTMTSDQIRLSARSTPLAITRVAVIKNANASERRVRDLVRCAGESNLHVEVVSTTSFEEGCAAARNAVAKGAHALIAAGGDGTVLSCLCAIEGTNVALGTLPLGTANDLATHIASRSPEALVRSMKEGPKRAIDVGSCTLWQDGRARRLPFVTTAGVGLIADVMRREKSPGAARMKRLLGNGVWPFLLSASWRENKPVMSDVTFDGKPFRDLLAVLEVCKIPTPGGITLAPGADLDTGILHAFYFGALESAKYTAAVARALTSYGGHLREGGGVHYVSTDAAMNSAGVSRVKEIHVAPESPMPVHVHGEFLGTTPVTFRLEERTVTLV